MGKSESMFHGIFSEGKLVTNNPLVSSNDILSYYTMNQWLLHVNYVSPPVHNTAQ